MKMPDFTLLVAVRLRRPLVHCISNLVSANDCANLALAVGASPIMAQAPQEMASIASASASEPPPVAYYTLAGSKTTNPTGLTIARMSDGSSRKLLITQ